MARRTLRQWWDSFFRIATPSVRLGPVIELASMSDLPDILGKRLFVVGPRTMPKWLVLMCPCGCGQRLDANLSRSRRPYWSIEMRNDRLTAWPSLAVDGDSCDCHFWLRENNVFLAEYESDERPRR
jgi:hypothetical protein